MTDLLDRPMPSNVDAEGAILGAILSDNRAWFRVMPLVQASDFFRDANRVIFATAADALRRGESIDLLTLKAELEKRKKLVDVGGVAYVASLVDRIPDIANVERYADLVAREAKRRRLIAAGNSLITRSLVGEDEPESIAADAMAALTSAATNSDSQARHIAEVLDDAFAGAQGRYERGEINGLTTGLKLDEYRAIYSTLIIVGSPSKHGKTGLQINLADKLAENGHASVFFTLESTTEEVAWRYVSANANVPHTRVRDWKYLTAGDMASMAQVRAVAAKRPIWMTRRIRSIEEIYAECRRLKTLGRLDAALIDYVQLVRYPGGPRDREERIAYIAQRLLEMALDLDIAVICGSQVNKDWMERDSGLLQPTDLKYAAAIGESARVVLMFQRPHVYKPEELPCKVLFQVAAHNEGRTGTYEMHFNEVTQRFSDGDCAAAGCRRAQPEPETTLFR